MIFPIVYCQQEGCTQQCITDLILLNLKAVAYFLKLFNIWRYTSHCSADIGFREKIKQCAGAREIKFSKSSSHYYLCFLPPHSSNPSRYGTSFYRWIMWLHNAMSYGLWERCEANQSVEQTRWLLIESRKLKKASLQRLASTSKWSTVEPKLDSTFCKNLSIVR